MTEKKTRAVRIPPGAMDLCELMCDGWEVAFFLTRVFLRRKRDGGDPRYPYESKRLRWPTLEAALRLGLVVRDREKVTLTDNGRVVGTVRAGGEVSHG